MLQRDYLVRQLEQLAQALARIVARRRAGDEATAEHELGELAQKWFGLPLDLLAGMPDIELFALLTQDGRPDLARIALLVRLLCERGDAAERPADLRRAVRLMAALAQHGGEKSAVPHREAFTRALTVSSSAELPTAVMHDLWAAYELVGAYARAEDVLYRLLDIEPSGYAGLGEAFYRRLLQRDDEELERGGLPREEVSEGLARCRERAGG